MGRWDIVELVRDSDLYLAHRSKGGDGGVETLDEHSRLVLDQFYVMDQKNGIMDKIRVLFKDLDREVRDPNVFHAMEELFVQAIYLHDIGKVNRRFQVVKMRSEVDDEKNRTKFSTDHSLISSLIYLDVAFDYVDGLDINRDDRNVLRNLAFYFSYVISRHHGYLNDFLKDDYYLGKLDKLFLEIKRMPDVIDGYVYLDRLMSRDLISNLKDVPNYRYDNNDRVVMWLLVKMLYSSLVTADFMATRIYHSGKLPIIEQLDDGDVKGMIDSFEKNEVIQGIREYKSTTLPFADPINTLRSDMFLESENSLLNNLDKRIFYLEAPTGSGKTLTSINLALRMLENDRSMKKLQYIFPFNALVEQTNGVLTGIFGEKFNVVNSLTEIGNIGYSFVEKSEGRNGDSDVELDYGEVVLQRQNMQYKNVITSHVNLFNRIFGVSRESNLSFTNLCNSVIVIDEIQSYLNEIWLEMIEYLHVISKYMNIRFVIMSATLPNLSKKAKRVRNSEMCELIRDRDKYFSNPLFRDRVKIDFSLLSNTYTRMEMGNFVEDFMKVYERHGKYKKYLIEFISKKSARIFFEELSNLMADDVTLIELTGDDNKYVRGRMIGNIKSKEFYGIVVATQVIEAGVDIDMDVGLKDISLLDSEEQFLGRINRSCQREGIAYFFNMDYAQGIYLDDVRSNLSILNESCRDMLLTKDFRRYYERVLDTLNKKTTIKSAKTKVSSNKLLLRGEYKSFSDHLRLINSKTVTVFIDYELEKSEGTIIRGRDVWEEYKRIDESREMDFSEKKVRLSRLKDVFSYFTYNIFVNKKLEGKDGVLLIDHDELYDGIYYVNDGECYMDAYDGVKKFSQSKYLGTGD